MNATFDYALEDKLSRLAESIYHNSCDECKDARIARLELRISQFHSQKRRREGDGDDDVVYHDALEGEYYPFGAEHHPNVPSLTKRKRLSDGNVALDAKRSDDPSCTPTKRLGTEPQYVSQSSEDELLGFLDKLTEHKANKKRCVPAASFKGDCNYLRNAYDVDLITLKAHNKLKANLEDGNTENIQENQKIQETQQPESSSEVHCNVALELPQESAKDETNVEEKRREQGTGSLYNSEDKPEVHSLEKESSQSILPVHVTPPPTTEEVVKQDEVIEQLKDDENSIFGASTLEKLNFSMPAGNPLFAPKAIDASHFTLPKVPPVFVFGTQPTPSTAPATVPTHFQQYGVNVPPPLTPQPGPLFNIPGFSGAPLGQQMGNAPNTFAMNAFPKAKRGMMRHRGGRH